MAIAGTLGPGYLEGNTTHKKISCAGGHLTGTVPGPKTTKDNVITFTGCTAESGLYKCENTVTEGEVFSGQLPFTGDQLTSNIEAWNGSSWEASTEVAVLAVVATLKTVVAGNLGVTK